MIFDLNPIYFQCPQAHENGDFTLKEDGDLGYHPGDIRGLDFDLPIFQLE